MDVSETKDGPIRIARTNQSLKTRLASEIGLH